MPELLSPVEPSGEVARRNVLLGWVLFGLAVTIVVGSLLVALIYLQYD
jgi:hypothetical protein